MDVESANEFLNRLDDSGNLREELTPVTIEKGIGVNELKRLKFRGYNVPPDRELSFSSLKSIISGGAEIINYFCKKRTSTVPMIEGTLFEALCFNGIRFDERYILLKKPDPTGNWAKKANKDEKVRVEKLAKGNGKEVVPQESYDKVMEMIEVTEQLVSGNDRASDLIKHMRACEQQKEFSFTQKFSGLKIRGFIDFHHENGGIELKSINNISEIEKRLFSRYSFSYWLQVAVYCEAMSYENFTIVFMAKEEPFMLHAITFNKEQIDLLINHANEHVYNKYLWHLEHGFMSQPPTWYKEPDLKLRDLKNKTYL